MSNTSQRCANKRYRERLAERGMARFEVLGHKTDRELFRLLAKRLAEEGPEADRLQTVVSRLVSDESPRKGGVLQALRRSPLVGADIVPPRPFENGHKADL